MDSKKLKKKKGPIRFEAIIPVTIIGILTFLYFHFLFDANLKSGAQWMLTKANGAEVNIGDIETSFTNASFKMTNLNITDKEVPKRNKISVKEISFRVSWDALLRFKFLINKVNLTGIEALTPRKSAGFIVPEPTVEEKENNLLNKSKDLALKKTEQKYDQNIVGNLAGLLQGGSSKDQTNKIKETLESEKKINALSNDLKNKQALWQKQISSLPTSDEITKNLEDIKDLKIDKRNPLTFLKSLDKANKSIKKIDSQQKQITKTVNAIDNDIKNFQNEFKQIDKYIADDIKSLQKRLKLPSIDSKDISQQVLMDMVVSKFAKYKKYLDWVKEHIPLPKKKEKAVKEKTIYDDNSGRTFQFPVTVGYPLLWIKEVNISSKESQSPYSGNVEGFIKDITSDQRVTKKLTTANIKANFPKQDIFGVTIDGVLDFYTKDAPMQRVQVNIASFPSPPINFIDTKESKLGIKKAKTSAKILAELRDKNLSLGLESRYTDSVWNVKSKSDQVQSLLTDATSSMEALTIDAKAIGKINNLKIDIKSNLGQAIQKTISGKINQKINEEKEKLNKMVSEKISSAKKDLEKQFNQVKEQIDKISKAKEEKIKEVKKSAQKMVK